MTPRVVVTGLGVISSAGTDAASFLTSVAAGRSCLSTVSDPRYKPEIRVVAGLIPALPPSVPVLPATWPVLDRFVYLALAAARQALAQAGVEPRMLGMRMGAIVGTCSGPTTLIEAFYQDVLDGKAERSPAQSFRIGYGSAARALAGVFGICGMTGTVTTACSAGLTAIGTGADLIRAGLTDVMLVGGADAYSISTQIGFDGLKAPCDGPSAPFSKPLGLSLGEGGAFLVLENRERALARNAPILAEILGFGTSNDAYHCSSPDPSGNGQALAVLRAIEDAAIERSAVAYVNAHGTGTPANDKAETKAIRRVFGAQAAGLPVSSQKASFGHTLGAAGALEAAATLLCRGAGVLPPTANFKEAREGCDLDYVATPGRPWPEGRLWIKESFAFGGHNAAMVFGPAEGAAYSGRVSGGDAVCISGMGMVTPYGVGRDALARLSNGEALASQECQAPGRPAIRAALVSGEFDPDLERKLGLRRMDKAGALGTVAAYHAMADAGIAVRPGVTENVGLMLGHASGSNSAEASFVPQLLASHYVIQSVADFPFVVPNATAGTICRALGLRGQNAAFCFGEGAGLLSLVAAASAIRIGRASLLLAGAVDVLSQRGWGDRVPDAAVLPMEGAAMLVLENETSVRKRGGKVLARISAMVVATDPEAGWDAPPRDLVVQAVAEAALANARVGLSELGAAFGPVGRLLGWPAAGGTGRTGWAEAAGPLFDAVEAVGAGGAGFRRPALLSLSSRQGLAVSVVISPCFETDEGKI